MWYVHHSLCAWRKFDFPQPLLMILVMVMKCCLTDLQIAFLLSVGLLDQYLKVLETSYSKEIFITYFLHFVSIRKMNCCYTVAVLFLCSL